MKLQPTHPSRREFLKKSLLTGALFPMINKLPSHDNALVDNPLKVHIFSKHLQFLNYADMAEAAAEMGFDGIDLTVRPGGHVLPERVDTGLPDAVEAMRKVGFAPLMMVTAVDDAQDDLDKKVLEVAAGLGFQYYRMNWFSYPDGKSIPESMEYFRRKITALGKLNKELRLKGCYQNHSGNLAGASLWELWELLRDADPQFMGVQYDIRHAVVEGGLSWQNGLKLVQPYIKTLAVKDCRWEKKNDQWVVVDTPIGEGMIDFNTYFKLFEAISSAGSRIPAY